MEKHSEKLVKDVLNFKRQGYSYAQIATELSLPSEDTARNIYKRNKEELLHVIPADNKEVVITGAELEKLKELYCGAKLTINQICRNLEISRQDFMVIKNAFRIAKDDLPLTDRKIVDCYDTNDLIEKVLQSKKMEGVAN